MSDATNIGSGRLSIIKDVCYFARSSTSSGFIRRNVAHRSRDRIVLALKFANQDDWRLGQYIAEVTGEYAYICWPRVEMDAMGNAMITWIGGYPNSSLHYVRNNMAEDRWTKPAQVYAGSGLVAPDYRLGVDEEGNAFLAWLEVLDDDYVLNVIHSSATQAEWTEPTGLAEFEDPDEQPLVGLGVGATGDALVVWQFEVDERWQLEVAGYRNGERTWSRGEAWSAGEGAGPLSKIDIEVNASGTGTVVWVLETVKGQDRIGHWGNDYNPRGIGWVQAQPLGSGHVHSIEPVDLQMTADGEAIVVWGQENTVENLMSIFASHYRRP